MNRGLLDFADLLLIARDLLTDPEYGKSVVERFHRQFRQLMVDEFQDTDPLQFDIIHALQGDGHLFVVGDAKQAIYRFIGSDIGVFLEQERHILELGAQGERISMHANYRSRARIAGAVERIVRAALATGRRHGRFAAEPLEAERQFGEKSILY